MTAAKKIGDSVTVVDAERGTVTGAVVGHNHEGYPLVSFNDEPPVVVFPDMMIVG